MQPWLVRWYLVDGSVDVKRDASWSDADRFFTLLAGLIHDGAAAGLLGVSLVDASADRVVSSVGCVGIG